jgi:hypothetical protein
MIYLTNWWVGVYRNTTPVRHTTDEQNTCNPCWTNKLSYCSKTIINTNVNKPYFNGLLVFTMLRDSDLSCLGHLVWGVYNFCFSIVSFRDNKQVFSLTTDDPEGIINTCNPCWTNKLSYCSKTIINTNVNKPYILLFYCRPLLFNFYILLSIWLFWHKFSMFYSTLPFEEESDNRNRISSVMVIVLASITVNRGF